MRSRFLRHGLVSLIAVLALGSSPASAQPFQDSMLYTAPVGTVSVLGGPTPEGEVTILRERFFEVAAPDMTGSGVTLDAGDTDRDGLFSQSIFVRSGPVVDNSRNPETEAAILFPPSVTVVGVVFASGSLMSTDTTWGLAPGVDYTASARAMEIGGSTEFVTITVDALGTTVAFRTQMNASPFTDEFRILVDHGAAWVPSLVAQVRVSVGDDVNIGEMDGGRTGNPVNYRAELPLSNGCGDGIVGPREACDDGGTTAGDGCSATCTIEPGYMCIGMPSVCSSRCGDGVVASDERCDDGNTMSGDGCDASCSIERGYMCTGMPSDCNEICGDGRIVGDEECDDSNTRAGDGCDALCEIEPGFMCEDIPSDCTNICGDGRIVRGERCDDGNNTAGDGCSATCAIEPGYMCMGMPSDCDEICGDGRIVGAEECDDGNTMASDGCDAMCVVEDGSVCVGTPSVCGVCVDTVRGPGTDLGCMAASPLCVGSGTTAFCAPCVDSTTGGTDLGCMASAPACDISMTPTHVCLGCEDTAGGDGVDNGCNADAPVCSTAGDAPMCFECTTNDHCDAGTLCGPAGMCVPGCNDSSDCVSSPATPVCDVDGEVCVECLTNDQCVGTQVCNMNSCEAVDTDGDGTPDDDDLDDDNDGIPDSDEIDSALTGDSDDDGILDFEDSSIATCTDEDPDDGVCDSLPMDIDFDGDGIANHLDLDADGDGISDLIEGGGDDSDGDAKVDSYADANGDGLHDPYAASPLPLPNSDDSEGPDFLDLDADGDGVTDTHEAGGTDVDMDGRPDDNSDGNSDGIADVLVGDGQLPIPDTDMDGLPDYQDPDDDGDGVLTEFEGPIAVDTDLDGIPDYLDPDDDGDSIPTADENADANGDGDPSDARDSDGDGTPDYLDPDGVVGEDAGAGFDAGAGSDGGGAADAGAANDGGVGSDGGGGDGATGGVSGGAFCTASPGNDGSPAMLFMMLLAVGILRRKR